MYEFLPFAWRYNTLGDVAVDLLILAIYFSAVLWIVIKSRSLKQYGLTLITILVLLATLFFTVGSFENRPGTPTSYPVFVILTWSIAGTAAIANLIRLNSDAESLLVLKSFRELIVSAICGTFLLFLLSVCIINFGGLGGHRVTAHRQQCLNNMRNVGVAIQMYATENRGDIPATEAGDPPHSWRVEVLPFLEQQGLHDRYVFDQPWNGGTNEEIARTSIEVFECPSAPLAATSEGYALTGYAAITGTNAMWDKKKSLNLETVSKGDGLSQTLLIVEACGQNIAWSEPRDVDLDSMPMGINLPGKKAGQSDGLLSGYHGRTVNVVFGDGSARNLAGTMDLEVLKKLCTGTGGEILSGKDY